MPTRKTKTRPTSSPKAKANEDQLRAERGALSRWIVAAILALSIGIVYVASMKRLADYDHEAQLWQQVVKYQPTNYFAHNNLGDMLLRSGRLPEAISEFRLSLSLKPDHYLALNNGQQEVAKSAEEWLTHYREEIGRGSPS